jgi:hypothetical protein
VWCSKQQAGAARTRQALSSVVWCSVQGGCCVVSSARMCVFAVFAGGTGRVSVAQWTELLAFCQLQLGWVSCAVPWPAIVDVMVVSRSMIDCLLVNSACNFTCLLLRFTYVQTATGKDRPRDHTQTNEHALNEPHTHAAVLPHSRPQLSWLPAPPACCVFAANACCCC